jgi:hypothetical protein
MRLSIYYFTLIPRSGNYFFHGTPGAVSNFGATVNKPWGNPASEGMGLVIKLLKHLFSLSVDALKVMDKLPVLSRRTMLQIFKHRGAEIGIAAVGPQVAADRAAAFVKELARICLGNRRVIYGHACSQRSKINDIFVLMIRMPVDAADAPAIRTDRSTGILLAFVHGYNQAGDFTG